MSSAFVHSAECRLLLQVTFESLQFPNLDNSMDIADRIDVLYVVDSYVCICRFGILLRQIMTPEFNNGCRFALPDPK